MECRGFVLDERSDMTGNKIHLRAHDKNLIAAAFEEERGFSIPVTHAARSCCGGRGGEARGE